MTIPHYGVLKGRPTGKACDPAADATPHFNIRLAVGDEQHRVAINVRSAASPSELLYLVDENFQHPITAGLAGLADGFTAIESKPGGLALDYIRGNLLKRGDMLILPDHGPGANDDLCELFDAHTSRAMSDPESAVFAFGSRFGPDNKPNIFNLHPDRGIHDIHMNQGNVDAREMGGRDFTKDDGVWQDGGVIFHLPSTNRWVAVFLAFQSQAWHTDDVTGHTITEVPPATDLKIRIVAALVNPVGPDPEPETVTLLNTTTEPVPLAGWMIADRLKNKFPLSGTIDAGATMVARLGAPVHLGNKGGIITLLNPDKLKVDGVSYTAAQAREEGRTIVFG